MAPPHSVVGSDAREALGFDKEDALVPLEEDLFWALCNTPSGWPDTENAEAMAAAIEARDKMAYARAGAAHIDAFIAKYCEGA